MQKIFLFLAVAVLLPLVGCKSTYDVSYQDQGYKVKVQGIAKPVYDAKTDTYTFTDAKGQKITKDAGLIRDIRPHQNDSSVSESSFKKSR
jgi:uncharacterized protein YceK